MTFVGTISTQYKNCSPGCYISTDDKRALRLGCIYKARRSLRWFGTRRDKQQHPTESKLLFWNQDLDVVNIQTETVLYQEEEILLDRTVNTTTIAS